MGQHIDQLQAKIANLETEAAKTQEIIGRVTGDLQATLGRDPVDSKKADALQVKRDELTRTAERHQLRLELLEKERPACERLDAQDRLNSILGEACAVAERAEADRGRYEAALSVLASSVDSAYQPALDRRDLQREAEYLSEMYDLPMPALPDISQPEPAAVKSIFARAVGFYELLYQVYSGEWASKLAEIRSQRKQAAARERNAHSPNRSSESLLS